MTKNETGTSGLRVRIEDVGLSDWNSWTWTRGRGLADVGLGDVGLGYVVLGDLRLGDVELGDVGLGDVDTGTQGRDKQTTPDICAEFVEYIFRWSRDSYHMLESLLVEADGFQRPWFGQTCLLAYLTVRTLGTE